MTSKLRIRVDRLATAEQLAALDGAWNALAGGVPFRSWEWLESWWRAYGAEPGRELFTLTVCDHRDELVGLAPWYLERWGSRRKVIRFLGSGEVCSDYLTILCRDGYDEEVTGALADWLCLAHDGSANGRPGWDLLELGGVDRTDKTVNRLVEHLAARGKLVHRRNRSSCWRVNLPSEWDDYLAMLSKSHRKQIRRLERKYFDTGRAQLHEARSEAELDRGWEMLTWLHRRRRESLGDPGCFASPRFAVFHVATSRRLLHTGNLRLVWLEVDGRAVAAEYQVLGPGVVYAYQSGIEPAALSLAPGRLITLAMLKRAIAEGRRAFDFLRGDEEYKAHWRAEPRPTQDIRVVSNAPGARLQHNLWLARGNVKNWLKQSLKLSGVLSFQTATQMVWCDSRSRRTR
ncbi:MAG: GNAT family N-acetyltransferase [Planctomycetia bacterium]|nr:GNAT family N-acetyltransferase [Planctomycetia bacterium]